MVSKHNGTENVEEETRTLPRTNRRSVRAGRLSAALMGATTAGITASRFWRSSAGVDARSAGTSLRLSGWDIRQYV